MRGLVDCVLEGWGGPGVELREHMSSRDDDLAGGQNKMKNDACGDKCATCDEQDIRGHRHTFGLHAGFEIVL